MCCTYLGCGPYTSRRVASLRTFPAAALVYRNETSPISRTGLLLPASIYVLENIEMVRVSIYVQLKTRYGDHDGSNSTLFGLLEYEDCRRIDIL